MFDNPRKNLKDLETALRWEEQDYESEEQEDEEESESLPQIPNRIAKRQVNRRFRENHAREQKQRRHSKETKPKSKQKSSRKVAFGGQFLLAIGEIILIIVIVRWWLQWMG